jgi:hypothetical protein
MPQTKVTGRNLQPKDQKFKNRNRSLAALKQRTFSELINHSADLLPQLLFAGACPGRKRQHTRARMLPLEHVQSIMQLIV